MSLETGEIASLGVAGPNSETGGVAPSSYWQVPEPQSASVQQ